MKRFLLPLLFLNATFCLAQVQSTVLELPDANVHINTNGSFFNDLQNGLPGYETPAGSSTHSIYASSVWMAGLAPTPEDTVDYLHCAAFRNCMDFCEIYPGPLTNDGSATYNETEAMAYNRFWFISREQVETHVAYYACLNDPDCDTEVDFPGGYTLPDDILEWPAHGDTAVGYAYHLAPFIDVDGDGTYQPDNGDYPSFTGDKAVYLISNDGGVHNSSNGLPLGVEIHTLIYIYLDTDPALASSVFVHQDFINRSSNNYYDTRLGIYNDFDLGNPSDDYIGTNVKNAFIYAYNGDELDDGSTSGPGYGTDLPIMACKILAGPYLDPNGIDDIAATNGEEYGDFTKGWNDGIVDNERMGLSGSIFFNNSGGPTADPGFSIEYYNYLKNTWLNGAPFTFGGTGYNPADPMVPSAKYAYPGESDPLFTGTSGTDPGYSNPGGWTEGNAGNAPGDRRMLASCGPFSLNSGQVQSLDYVYVFARQSDNPDEDPFDLISNAVTTAAAYPDSLPTGVISSVKQVRPDRIGFTLYPNPAAENITLTLSGNTGAATYRIYNIPGAQVRSGIVSGSKATVDISGLEHGLYLVTITVGDRTTTRKLVVGF